MTPEQETALIKAADELHRITVNTYGVTNAWQRLGALLDEIDPVDFYRLTGDDRLPAP